MKGGVNHRSWPPLLKSALPVLALLLFWQMV
jgi:hypothetical protein